MFTVMCTKDSGQISQKTGLVVDWLKFGKKYHVLAVLKSEQYAAKQGYVLQEFGGRVAFGAEFFTLVDGPDEVRIAEERIAADAAELDAEWGRIIHKGESL